MSFLNKIQKISAVRNRNQKKIEVNTKDKQVYITKKKLSEEIEQNPSEPHSLAVLLSVRDHSHIQVAIRSTQWMFMGWY